MNTETTDKPLIDTDILLDTIVSKLQKICFVCTGNTCRSPMAAAVLNNLGNKYNFKAISAGIYAKTGDLISENAVAALEDENIFSTPENDYKNHTARIISEADMRGCDKIVGITSNHAMTLITMFPQYAAKIFTFAHDISDPFGGDADDYKACLRDITECIRDMFKLYD